LVLLRLPKQTILNRRQHLENTTSKRQILTKERKKILRTKFLGMLR